MSVFSWWKTVGLGSLVFMGAVGCGSEPVESEPDYGFGETDMQNLIVGNWLGSMTLSGQPTPKNFVLAIARANPSLGPACGSRTFNSPLCIESSSMELDGTLTTQDKTFDAVPMTGQFMVIGLELQNGELSLLGGGLNLTANIDPAKATQDVTISGDYSGAAVIQR